MNKLRRMTEHEKLVMGLIWEMPDHQGTIHDFLINCKEPKPAYTTLATFLRIMQKKGFVTATKTPGVKSMVYQAVTTKEEFLKKEVFDLANVFFGGSVELLAKFVSECAEEAKRAAEESAPAVDADTVGLVE